MPLAHALRDREIAVHFASLSFCYLNGLEGARQDPDHPNLYAVDGDAATEHAYCPEAWLARVVGGPIWCFDKTGVRPLAAAYRALVGRLAIDAVVLVDGGIDAVLRGDETSLGTPSEDLASLAAVAALDEVPVRILACVGLGAEMRDGIQHAQVFARIAELTREGAYLGAAALVPGAPETDAYLAAVEHVFAHQRDQKRSHVHAVVTAAARGDYGAVAPSVWLSPLLSMFWFFDAAAVARTHFFLRELAGTESIWQVAAIIEGIRKQIGIRPREPIPL